MKTLLALLLIPTAVLAAPFHAQKPVVCDNSKIVSEELTKKYNEQPALMLQNNDTVILVTINPGTSTWTILETQDNNIVCALGSGAGLKFNIDILKGNK